MERAMRRHAGSAPAGLILRPEVERTESLMSDLAAISEVDARTLPLLPEGQAYAARISEAAEGSGARLIAHAYARYLGDLSGGQILKRLLGRSPGLAPEALSFYEFPAIADIATFKASYRAAIEQAGELLEPAEFADVVAESERAFELNIDLSLAVQKAGQ
jgi:heme oxygenase